MKRRASHLTSFTDVEAHQTAICCCYQKCKLMHLLGLIPVEGGVASNELLRGSGIREEQFSIEFGILRKGGGVNVELFPLYM